MTPASSKTQIIWLEDRIINLEKRLDAVERLTKPPTKPITTGKVSRQWGWTLIPKPLTSEEIAQIAEHVGLLGAKSRAGNAHDAAEKLVRAVERHHGIGEKE